MSDPERPEASQPRTSAGSPIARVYRPQDVDAIDAEGAIGEPGSPPFTRGIHPDGYRGRPWTMRQYAGFGSAAETNRRFRYLLERGQTGLSVAFDLPTQMGYDSDDALAVGEVGRVGVPIDSIDDMELLLDGIDPGAVSTSMTINATAAILLVLYETVARRRGVDPRSLRGTIQNDILKEYIARGTYIFPPAPSMRLVTDTFAYCRAELPSWNTISISGYHMREAGATAVQEVAFTVANAIAYADAAKAAGLAFDDFAPRLSFFFAAHNDLLEEVAKFRAARRVWSTVARERFGAVDPRSMAMRFHVQTGGSTLTAQQPDVNVVRTTIQGLSAALGGAQSDSHQRARRGARAAHAVIGPAGTAHATSAVSRVRCGRDRRPAGWLVVRRAPHRRDRHGRDGGDHRDRCPRRHVGRARRRLPAERDR